MTISVRTRSRLRFGSVQLIDGVEFWDLLQLPDIPIQQDDILYPVQGADRIDSIANAFYGDPILWWVIALANDMDLLPPDLQVGSTIRIPAPRYVLQVLFTNTSK